MSLDFIILMTTVTRQPARVTVRLKVAIVVTEETEDTD